MYYPLMATVTFKNENIHFRVSPEAKSVIEKALSITGSSLTEFATSSLLDSANKVIENEYTTVLSNRDRDMILALLDADAEPTEALKEAARLHRELFNNAQD